MKSGRDSTKSKSTKNTKLSPFARFILYGLLGFTCDVYYFAMLDTLLKGELDLVGRSNVLILPIYGLAFLLLERIAPYLKHKNVSIYMRGLIYTVMGYTFEFTTGYFLLMIGQDYWDYSDFSYNLKGLIIPHTGLLWTLFGLVSEYFIIDWVKRLTFSSK
ncbi:hypothetical protein HA402_012903 [Bradysia odoriphaga]|nr:hypothetical protein HA402_012903 [Bradysia odoriphaga]